MLQVTLRMLYTPEEHTFPADLKILIEAYKKDLERAVSHRDQYGGKGKTYDRYKQNIKDANHAIYSLEKQLALYQPYVTPDGEIYQEPNKQGE